MFGETSAKSGEGLNEIFEQVARKVLQAVQPEPKKQETVEVQNFVHNTPKKKRRC